MAAKATAGRLPLSQVYTTLLRLARPPARALAAIVALTLATALIAVALPWPLQYLVDHVLSPRPRSGDLFPLPSSLFPVQSKPALVLLLAAVGLLLHVANGFLNVARTRLEVAAGQRSVYTLRACLFDHLQRQSLRQHQAQLRGDQLYRLSDDTYCVDQLIFSGLLPLVGAGLTLLAMLCVLWRLDAELALLALLVVPFLSACVRYYIGPLERESEQVREREAAVLGFAEQVLGALPIVKAFVRERDEARRFHEHGENALRARLRLTAQETWFGLAVGTVTAGGTALVLAIGGLHVLHGTLSLGQLLVVLAYLAQVYDPLHIISHTLGQMQTAVAGARRVLEALQTDVESREEAAHGRPLPPIQGHIVFDHVGFGYDPEIPVLHDIAFNAPPGTVLAVVGPTGAGKTTLASLLLRFYDPQQGRILLDGIPLPEVPVTALRRQISIVPQEAILFPVSIGENIRYGKPDATDAEVQAAARAAHADGFISLLPDGYDTPVAPGGASLSGGERQRIALARAFIKDAPILILDEPTSALDAATEALILESLERLMAGRTTLVIAHRLSTIRRASQILFLQDGRIVERGTHGELLAEEGSYARLHQLYMRTVGASD